MSAPETHSDTKKPSNQIKPWNDPNKRATFFQVLLIVVVSSFFYVIVNNALSNLEQRGITTGFGFLDVEAGFGILQSLIDYSATDTYGKTFVVGLLNTVLVSVLSIITATVLGFVIGIGRLSKNWLVAKFCAVYVEIFRNIPLLLQIFFWYFAVLRTLPTPRNSLEFFGSALNIRGFYVPKVIQEEGFSIVTTMMVVAVIASILMRVWAKRRHTLTGKDFPIWRMSVLLIIGLPLLTFLALGSPASLEYPELKGFNYRGGITLIPELMALWLALTVYTASYIAEIIRGGILAVPFGQIEASSALGLPKGRTLRFIIIPQAMRVIIPPLTSMYLNITKNSSLAMAVGYPDLVSVFAGTTLNQTGQAIEIIFMTMGVYLTLSILTSMFMNWYNKRQSLIER